jgi:hypothetical protein
MKLRLLQIGVILAILWGLVSCAPKAVIVEPIVPAVVRVRAQVAAANASSQRLEESVGGIRASVSAMGVEIDHTLAAAETLRDRGSASQQELDDQWQALAGLQTRNLFLEAEVQSAAVHASEQKTLRETASASLAELEIAAIATDKSVETLKTQLVKQADHAALGKSVKTIGWVISGLAVVSVVVWGVSKVELI